VTIWTQLSPEQLPPVQYSELRTSGFDFHSLMYQSEVLFQVDVITIY